MVCDTPNEIFCGVSDNTCVQMCAPVGTYWDYSESEDKFVPVSYKNQQNGSWWLPRIVKDAKERKKVRVLYQSLPQHCEPVGYEIEEILPNGDLSLGKNECKCPKIHKHSDLAKFL